MNKKETRTNGISNRMKPVIKAWLKEKYPNQFNDWIENMVLKDKDFRKFKKIFENE
jgi:hypothetical protein